MRQGLSQRIVLEIRLNSLALLKYLSMATLQDMIGKLQRFGDEIQDLSGKQFTLVPDQNDMIDRQCPQCSAFFMILDSDIDKLKEGTYCPACGHKGNGSDFITEAHHKAVKEAIEKSLHNNWQRSTPIPNIIINLQSTLALENQIRCSNCNLAFSISQAAQYCPGCGSHQ
jgi:predicted RNA-binding Zn-ribbon protein involved in translation (DUF1610 family)